MGKATRQWLGLGAAAAAGVAVGAWMHARPLDAERLHVQVAPLASLAAEAVALDQQVRARRWPFREASVAAGHARQMDELLKQDLDRLRAARVEPPLLAAQGRAGASGGELATQVDVLARGGAADRGALERLAQDLDGQAKQLQQAGQ
jgi:hypothetical protein